MIEGKAAVGTTYRDDRFAAVNMARPRDILESVKEILAEGN